MITESQVKATAKVQNVSESSNCRTSYYQTWCDDVASWVIVSRGKMSFAVFMVKVTVRAHIINM